MDFEMELKKTGIRNAQYFMKLREGNYGRPNVHFRVSSSPLYSWASLLSREKGRECSMLVSVSQHEEDLQDVVK